MKPTFRRHPSLVFFLLAALAFAIVGPAHAQTYDEGKLDTSFFGGDLEFREADEVDYLWVKEGFAVDGRTLWFQEWPEHEFLGEKAHERDAEDHRLARQMTAEMHRLFADSWGRTLDGAKTTIEQSGDIRVVGRIVDSSTGNTAAKVLVGFGAGAGNTTIDLKFVDRKTGEVLVALHHRVVSGTSWSTTDSKFVKWTEKFAKNANKKGGLYGLYRSGERQKS